LGQKGGVKRGFEAAIPAYIAIRVPPTFFGAQPKKLIEIFDVRVDTI
jgi:hypothetical protein